MKDIGYTVYSDNDSYSHFTSLLVCIGNSPGKDKYDEEDIYIEIEEDERSYKKFWII